MAPKRKSKASHTADIDIVVDSAEKVKEPLEVEPEAPKQPLKKKKTIDQESRRPTGEDYTAQTTNHPKRCSISEKKTDRCSSKPWKGT
ncbi:hypothetical protein Pst134EA_011886 [Puccinia striiformis f. sp. tritici]|uniref:hypothetical protein n=1 Tax=Puccinia striiformis f. sp. tritici TaxID=168172 RepID=UPI002007E028|nr:hypothetical protein Pst134EA_011886 [Puccinia striiformis f. sp. tritici]KAH9468262.1 hypothetical protein Pst134EA_011886 [Puccinia striiformis f. sp. tritici]